MDNSQFDYKIDPEQLSLEAILAEYRAEEEISAAHRSAVEEKSRNIMIEALGDTILSSVDEPLSAQNTSEAEPRSVAEEIFGPDKEYETYAPPDFPEYDEAAAEVREKKSHRRQRQPRKKTFSETLMAPVVGLLASVAVRRHAEPNIHPTAAEIDEGPELAPKKAAKLYAAQLKSLTFRSRVATALSVLLAYITFAFTGFLPLGGALGSSTATAALVCLILLMSVMLAGLDIFTNGVLTLIHGNPGAESLAAVSCIFSIIDAVLVASGKLDFGLPMCAVSAWSICLGIWGSRFTCTAMLSTFSVLAEAKKTPMAITTEPGIVENAYCVVKTDITMDNFVRRSECADLSEISHIVAAPFLMAACFILALLASIRFGPGAFIHLLSAMTAACATFTALIAFPMPFSASAKRLHILGAALAGYEGCADIGASRRFVVLDRDIFPPHTISIDAIKISEKNRSEKVIGYTGSLIAASGCGLAPIFTKLMQKNSCTISKVEDFQFHEGGGILAHINAEEVLVGSSSFMSLMGIRLPNGLTAKNAVFTVINGELAGIFTITYTPTASVRRALEILLRDYKFPIFAVRDFNINPMMIRQKFKVVTDDFEFPTFAERYRVSAVEHDESSPIAAAVTRHGLGTMVEAADNARKLYQSTRILVILSLACAALGMGLVLLLCRGDAPSAALASRLLFFMFIWLAPVFVISHRL
ncbi:MAG: hypothetical protein AB7D36_01665 [Oscillospiraceae bacterium]